jgi:hypothetical protein
MLYIAQAATAYTLLVVHSKQPQPVCHSLYATAACNGKCTAALLLLLLSCLS